MALKALLEWTIQRRVRDPDEVGVARRKAAPRKQYVLQGQYVEATITRGEQAIAFMQERYGRDRTEEILAGMLPLVRDSEASSQGLAVDRRRAKYVPHGFWRLFIEGDRGQRYTDALRVVFRKAVVYVAQKRGEGATYLAAQRGSRKRFSKRGDGGALNRLLAPGLGHALLQFFVDHVQALMSRAHSHLMMAKARELRAWLVRQGHTESELPKLLDNAGHAWFQRWRKRYRIVRKATGLKMKVAWAKVKRRIQIWLTNLFRLKALWELCHPGKPMRFLSLDQKPSWFNNAGLTGALAVKGSRAPSVKENHAKTRERYTILTAVPSWGHDPHCPPKMCLLFKGADDGTIRRTLEKIPRLLPWTNILTWENGSYRSADMVEALDRMLPDAKDSSESIVVMLDGYPGHLPDEVRELVHSKGHVLLFHGRGCTPYAQVMDTNLHATLAGGQAGSVRIPLDKLGVWPQNRGTSSCSGLHVHEAAAGDPTAVPERP